MIASELLAWSLAELVARLRSGDVGSREATEAVLAALDGPGRALGAVARLYPETALAAADAADRARARGDLLGPLHGVPLAHKDMFYRSGELAECGATLMRGHRPTVTATVLAPPRCGRCDRCRPAQHGRVRARHHRAQRPYRPSAQPVGHEPDHRRLDQRRRRRGGRTAAARDPGLRHRRLDPLSRRLLRAGRPEADLRPRQPVRLHAAVVLARPYRPAGPLGRGCGPDHAGDRRRRPRRPDRHGATGAGLCGHHAQRRRRPSPGGGGSRPRHRGRRGGRRHLRARCRAAGRSRHERDPLVHPALRPAQCAAPAGDAGRDRGPASRAGRGQLWRLQPADRLPDGAGLRPLRRRLCPRAVRPCAHAAPVLRRGLRRRRCAGAADLPGHDARHRRDRHRRRSPLHGRRQPPGHPGRPVQLSRACPLSACPWASMPGACRWGSSSLPGHSRRRCCCGWPMPTRASPAVSLRPRPAEPRRWPSRPPLAACVPASCVASSWRSRPCCCSG